MKTYVISDLHFNHKNVIAYCSRPFLSVPEMGKSLIENWNSVVTDEDQVFFLGDFCFGPIDMIKELTYQLKGKKIIILGNHDRAARVYLEAGFAEAYKEYTISAGTFGNKEDILLTHRPHVTELRNIHGHIHNTPLDEMFDANLHFNASAENVNYKPKDITEIIQEKNW